jgi:hypothetical protein
MPKRIFFFLSFILFSTILTGCPEKDDSIGEEVDEAVEEIGDEIDDAI